MRICVIGAGPSGITAAKNLLDAGFRDLVVYDVGREVGGNWVFDAESGHSSVFETTHIISSKEYSQYADFPFPAGTPDYPSHEQLAAYFQAYAHHFRLYPFIEFQTLVKTCRRDADGHWEVLVERAGEERSERFDQLVVANGHHWDPRWPDYPGELRCRYLHSHDFKRAGEFAGDRVLVIGGGNSACDVAVETSRVSKSTDISWRRGYHIVPKFMFGQPTDHVYQHSHRFIGWLPMGLRLKLLAWVLRLFVGSNARYGLPEPQQPFGATHPTINSELLYFIRHGRIQPRPDISRFDGTRVHFVDGNVQEYDTVIACTGFRISHPFFERDLIDYSSGPVRLYLRMIHPEIDNLHFIGLFQPLGCIWPGAELQSKLMARRLAGEWQAPKDLNAAIDRELASPDVRQIDTPRHTITVDPISFQARLERELPVDYVSRIPVVSDEEVRNAPAA